jgi:hypothetical protein
MDYLSMKVHGKHQFLPILWQTTACCSLSCSENESNHLLYNANHHHQREGRDLPSDRCLSFEEGFPDLDIVSPSPPWPYTQTLWDEREGIVLVVLLLANPFQTYIRQPSSSSSEVETCETSLSSPWQRHNLVIWILWKIPSLLDI